MENIFDYLNSCLTKEDVANILRSFGFDASASRNFRLRDDDKNPSASIFINNRSNIPMIKDFGGGGFTGDIFKTLKVYANIPYKDSIEYIKAYLGIGNEKSFETKMFQKYTKKFNLIEKNKEILTPEEIESRWEKLYPLTSFEKTAKFKEVINKLVPFEYYEKAYEKNKKDFLERVRYSSYADDVAVKALTPEGRILAYKYRRWKDKEGNIIKWMALKGSPANKYSQIVIKNPAEPVFIIEGYHDYINAVLTDINFIAIPYKSYKNFKEEELALLKGGKYNFILIQDYDFDEKDEKKLKQKIKDSHQQANLLNRILSPFSKSGSIFVWNNIREKFKDLKNVDKIKDFSDAIVHFPFKSPSLFKKRLLYMANQTLEKKIKKDYKKEKTPRVSLIL